jgi:HK97 family phage prohead protease
MDISKALEMAGFKITLIQSGTKKTDGTPTAPLPDRVKADFQAEVDRLRGMFAQSVARNRACSFDALMETEAGIETAGDACPLLADAVGNMDDALAYLRSKVPQSSGTVDQPQGAEPGDRESPFNSAAPQKSEYQAAAEFNSAVLPNPAMLRLERADGSVLSYNPSDVDEMLMHGDHLGNEKGILAENGVDRDAYTRRATLLAGIREIRSEYPEAIGAIRSLQRRASVSTDGKVLILSAPYDGSVANLGTFDEVYRPFCFKNGLSRDMTVLFNHAESSAHVLGTTYAGTARFWEDAEGLHAEATPPDAQWWADLKESMARGDIRDASCAFWITSESWETRNGRRTRIVESAICHDASVEVNGAYRTASSSVKQAQGSALYNRARLEVARRRVS